MPMDNEIEAAAFQIHAEMGCTITAARICADRALTAGEQIRASEGSECECRARQIIEDENRMSATDDKSDIVLHALRWVRYGTAKQILGELPYGPLPPKPVTVD